MSNLVEETLTNHVREARQLYDRLFIDPFDKSSRQNCEMYLRLLTRYEFLTQMFNDLNWFGWRDEGFDIQKAINK